MNPFSAPVTRRRSSLRLVGPACIGAVFLAPLASAHVWFVGGSSPDFADIPPAIAAASDGDLILVRPGTYSAFTLNKGVQIRASSTPFKISSSTLVVRVENIGAGKSGGISGMLMPPGFIGLDWMLAVRNCTGEVILEEVEIDGFGLSGAPHNLRLDIADCANCTLTDLSVINGLEPGYSISGPAVTITRSSVRASGLNVVGATGLAGYSATGPEDGGSGDDGILLTDSFAVLAAPTIKGGAGGDGAVYTDPFGTTHWGDGGFGGDAVHLVRSTAILLGSAAHLLKGGDGGDGACDWMGCGQGGDGGDALWVESGSAEISLVTTTAGLGGANGGQPGLDLRGNGVRNDVLPWLSASGDLVPGALLTLDLQATQPGNVFLIVSDQGGFVDLAGFAGPPLSVLPGSFYFVLFLGATDGAGHLTLSGTIPNDPAVRGLRLELQAAVFDASAKSLTNAPVRVVGE